MGVPTIGCDCATCHSKDPHDRRTRPSVLVEFDGHAVLIDSTPDFREQALRERIQHLDAVLYTHGHADHILGLDDLRPLSFRHKEKLPLYAGKETAAVIEQVFQYVFDAKYKFGGLPQVSMNILNGDLELFGARFEVIKVVHGETEIDGFRFGSAAYLTDFNEIPDRSLSRLAGLDILFLDALRRRPHPTHSTVEQALKTVERLRPKRTFFTHIAHDLKHKETNATLPPGVRLAYDGLKLEFEL